MIKAGFHLLGINELLFSYQVLQRTEYKLFVAMLEKKFRLIFHVPTGVVVYAIFRCLVIAGTIFAIKISQFS